MGEVQIEILQSLIKAVSECLCPLMRRDSYKETIANVVEGRAL